MTRRARTEAPTALPYCCECRRIVARAEAADHFRSHEADRRTQALASVDQAEAARVARVRARRGTP